MIGIKGSNAATPGFAMYNNSGTLLGKLYASGTSLYWSDAKILTASGTSKQFVMGDGSLYSNTVSYTTWDKTTTSGIAWFPIADITDNDQGTALFMVRGYAHSSIIFTVTKGSATGNINVLAGGGDFNKGYAYIKGVRQIGTVVEIGLNAAATLVQTTIKVIQPTFIYSLRSSLVESTSTATPYVQYELNANGGNRNFGIVSSKFTGNLIGNADTASKWKDARTITLTGDVTGSVSLDGSSNVTLTTATSGTGTASFLKCLDKRNSYPAQIVTSGGNIGAAFMTASKLGLSDGNYYEALILRGWIDSSGGNENALLFSKSSSSVYHSQYAFGSTTTWGTMYKFLDSNNYSSYALPLSGGTLTGKLTMKANSIDNLPQIYRTDAAYISGIRFQNTLGYLGAIGMNAVNGSLYILDTANTTYEILDSRNYSNYAAAKSHTHPWSGITSKPSLLGAMANPIFYPYANDIKLGAYISTINNRFYSADLRYTVTTTNLSGNKHLLFDDNYDERMQMEPGTTATITIEGYNFIYNNGYIILYFYLYSVYPLLLPKSITAVATRRDGTTYTLNRATSVETQNTIAFSIGLEYLTKLEFTIVSQDNAYCGITNIDYYSRRTENTVRDCAVVTKYNANTLYHNLTAPKYIVSGGTSSQFLKADGSLDSTSYLKVDGSNGTSDGVSTLLNKLTTGSSTPTDADYYICQYAGGGTTTTTYVRRPMSALYTYIKSKLSLNPDERFIYATSATSNQYGTTEATGSSSTLTRTQFWRDNNRSMIGIYVQHSDNLNYGFELGSCYGKDALTYKRKFNGTWGTLQTVLTSNNYNSYSPTLTGTGASGTWAINISGVAASASKVANALTIQLNGGTTAGTNKFVYDGSSAYTINITPEAIGASATSHTHSYLPLSGGTLGSTSATQTELRLKSSTTTLRLLAYSDTFNYIQSGNADFNGSAPLHITGYNGTIGSDLYLKFTNIYCRSGDYTNIDSGNYSSYALPLSGGTLTGTINCKAIVPITDNGYSIGTSSKTLYEIHANFFKRRGSSNDYVLLGGGEHKLISDFVQNYTAVVPGGSVGNNDSWTLILNNNYSTGWYNPCTMFYIRSHNFGCGILCFYHYWDTSQTSGYYDNSVWFFGAEHSAYSGTMGGTDRDINNFLKVYIDKDNDNLKIYYNRYNNQSIYIQELQFSQYQAGTLYPKGQIRASHFITNGAVTDLPITSSTFVNIPIQTTKNHTEDIKTTRSVYASAFYENSDIRLKENVHSIDQIDLLKNVDLVQFNFKNDQNKKYGVIAQQLEQVGLQNLVYENNGNKAVDYISLLVLEIQRLRNEIGELKQEINKKS